MFACDVSYSDHLVIASLFIELLSIGRYLRKRFETYARVMAQDCGHIGALHLDENYRCQSCFIVLAVLLIARANL